MSDSFWLVLAIVLYFGVMVAIGFYSWRKTTKYDDYVLGDRGLGPLVAGISAGASDMSGWLLMGLPGALFVAGMSELWIVIGLFIGTWANWKWIAPRLRGYTEVAKNSITLPSFFENRTHDTSRVLRFTSAVIIIFFFTFYVSSGMVSGGRYYESTFGGEYIHGVLIVGSITVLYTFIGGFLAVSYTDVVQGGLMFLALITVPIMALRSPSEAKAARRTGTIWVAICYLGGIFTALVSTVYFSQKSASVTDQSGYETIFLDLARIMFHPLIAGIVLTAVLAAIMSTMSSQLLVTSSALIEDVYRIFKKNPNNTTLLVLSRAMVIGIALIGILLALNPSDTILGLVGFAWAGFGSAFGPVVVASLYWKRLTSQGAIAGMIVGAVTSFVWGSVDSLSGIIYEIVPGVILATLAMVIVSLATRPKEGVEEEFESAAAATDYALAHPDEDFSAALRNREGSTAV